MNQLGIDVCTEKAGDYNAFVRRLRALKRTIHVEEMGEYRECRGWRLLYVETTMNESELDAWCYRYNGRCYIELNAFTWTGDTP